MYIKSQKGITAVDIAISLIIIFIPFILELLFNIFGLYDLSNCGIS